MSDATKQLEDELRQKHNEVFRLEFQDTSGPSAVYFRALTAPEYNAALEKIMDKDAKRNALALKEVARRVLVHPTDDALEAILSRRPGVLTKVAGEAMALANGDAIDLGKRL